MSDKNKLFLEMCEIISDYSEESYCAGWLDGVEFTALTWLDEWEAGKYDEKGRFGISTRMPVAKLERLREIAVAHDMWPVWDDKANSPWYANGGCGPMPCSLAHARKQRDDYRAYWDKVILEGKWGFRKNAGDARTSELP